MAIEGQSELEKALDLLPGEVVKQAVKILNKNSRLLQSYIRTERMTGGTTETKLHARTGNLRGSVRVIPAVEVKTGAEGGVSIGTVYGRVHIGPKGQKTVIRPKKGKYLTIPLEPALTGAGVLKGGARSSIWGETFIAKSHKGNLIIWGRARIMKGKRQGELRGNILPLFLLVKQVTVKARIDPKDLLAWVEPKILEDFTSGRFKVVK